MAYLPPLDRDPQNVGLCHVHIPAPTQGQAGGSTRKGRHCEYTLTGGDMKTDEDTQNSNGLTLGTWVSSGSPGCTHWMPVAPRS